MGGSRLLRRRTAERNVADASREERKREGEILHLSSAFTHINKETLGGREHQRERETGREREGGDLRLALDFAAKELSVRLL